MTRMVTKRLKKRKRHDPFPFADMVMFMINGQASSGEDVDRGDLGETPYPAEEGPTPRYTPVKDHHVRPPSMMYRGRGLSPKGLSKSPSVPVGAVPGMIRSYCLTPEEEGPS